MDEEKRDGLEVETGAEATDNTGQEEQAKQPTGLDGIDLEELFNNEEVKKKVQSISDKRVTEALKTAKDNWQKELEDMQDEAKRLQKMSKEEKERYQFEKDKADFLKQKQAFEHNQLELQTARELLEKGLPDLSSFITGKDADETAQNIKHLSKVLGEWRQGVLNDAMRGDTIKDPTPQKKITREQLESMTRDEINKAYNEGLIDFGSL